MSARAASVGALSALTACALLACAGTETGNGADEKKRNAKVELKLTDADAPQNSTAFTGGDGDGAELVVTEAWAHFENLEFHLAEGVSCDALLGPAATIAPLAYAPRCADSDDRITVPGPWWVDLISGVTEPPIDALTLPVGDYTRVELRLRPEASPAAVGPPRNATLVARGDLDVDGAPTPFELELAFTAPMRFDGAAMVVDDHDVVRLLFDVRGWFSDVPFSTCASAGLLETNADGDLLLHDGRGPCAAAAPLLTVAIRASGILTGAPAR